MSLVIKEQESKQASQSGDLAEVQPYREYKYRFVIMALYCALSFTENMLWVTCSPITTNLQKIYDVSQVVINLSALIPMIVFIPASIPCTYLLDTFGIKIGLGVGAILQLIGAWVRLLGYKSFTYVLIGQLLAGLAQPLFIDSPQKVSTFWTVPKKRAMFTTILTLSTVVGAGVGFLLPGVIVGSEDSLIQGKALFVKLLFVEAIIATALTIPFFIFFRERPPTPPSASATVQRESYLKGLKSLIKNRSFIFLLMAQGISLGVLNTLAIVTESLCQPFGFSQFQASLFGVFFIIFGVIGCFVLGISIGKTRKYKSTLVLCIFTEILVIASMIGGNFSGSLVALSIISAIKGFFLAPLSPLGLELACELTFPVGEAISGGAINIMCNLMCITQIFTIGGIMTSIEDQKIGSVISTGVLVAFMILALVCALSVTEDLKRSKVDQSHGAQKEDKVQQELPNSDAKSSDNEIKSVDPETKSVDLETKSVDLETNSNNSDPKVEPDVIITVSST